MFVSSELMVLITLPNLVALRLPVCEYRLVAKPERFSLLVDQGIITEGQSPEVTIKTFLRSTND